MEETEKRYYLALNEKENLKTLISGKETFSQNEPNFPDTKGTINTEQAIKTAQDDIAYKKQIVINNITNINNKNNIISNLKNQKIIIKPRPLLKNKEENSTDDLINKTIDVDIRPSNFAIFSHNLTTRNAKVNYS